MWQSQAGHRWQYGACALHAGHLSPQTHTQNMQYLLIFHYKLHLGAPTLHQSHIAWLVKSKLRWLFYHSVLRKCAVENVVKWTVNNITASSGSCSEIRYIPIQATTDTGEAVTWQAISIQHSMLPTAYTSLSPHLHFTYLNTHKSARVKVSIGVLFSERSELFGHRRYHEWHRQTLLRSSQ